jgi:hypothetical protein
MKQLIREHIRRQVKQLVEERSYDLRRLSAGAADALGPGTLSVPPSAIIDVKIIKAPKPIFKCFLENGQSFNIIDNGDFIQVDVNRILFDMDREDDINGAKYELEKLMQKGSIKKDDEEAETDVPTAEPDTPAEEPAAEEPAAEPEA